MTLDSRAAILAAFARNLALYGYHGASLDVVAREVALKKPSIYHHFPGGKETLYVAVATEYVESQAARLTAAITSGEDLASTLRAIVVAFADPTGGVRGLDQRLYDALVQVEDDVRDQVATMYVSHLIDPVVTLFADAMDSGALTRRDPALVAHAFLELAKSVDARESDVDEVAAALVDLFLTGALVR